MSYLIMSKWEVLSVPFIYLFMSARGPFESNATYFPKLLVWEYSWAQFENEVRIV